MGCGGAQICLSCWNSRVFVSAWLAGDTGEQGDKGAKGYGLSGYTGDQGPIGKSTY